MSVTMTEFRAVCCTASSIDFHVFDRFWCRLGRLEQGPFVADSVMYLRPPVSVRRARVYSNPLPAGATVINKTRRYVLRVECKIFAYVTYEYPCSLRGI